MILSPENKKLINLKYKIEDKFFLKKESLTSKPYSKCMKKALSDNKVIVRISTLEINHMGLIGYRLEFIDSNLTWRWFVTEDILDEDFIYLGKNISAPRFIMIE